MAEPSQLDAARRYLSRAESAYRTEEGLDDLEEGLALLDEVALDSAPQYRTVATNLRLAYSSRICDSVREIVEANPGLPEPELEHLFKVLLAFDATDIELPGFARSLKIDIAKRLIDRYYEGYSADEKREALEQLAGIAGDEQ